MRTYVIAILAACVLVVTPSSFAKGGGGGHGGGHGGHGGHGGRGAAGAHGASNGGGRCSITAIRSRNDLCKGIGQLEDGSYADAVQRFSGVLQKDPNNIYGQTYLAMAYEASGDQANALKYYKQGAANTSNPTVHVELDGEYQKAKAAELCQTMVARIEANPAVASPNKEQP
jgi:hypothetical protein